MKVMTILGTRPEIIRLSEVIKELDRRFEHILVHTGQNFDYSLNEVFFDELGLRKPDYYLGINKGNLGARMGEVISKSFDLIGEVRPDCLLVLGDTNSALSAISAKRLKCPIFHMEAGNRCDDWNVAEMTNRVIVDHIADFNLPYSEFALGNLVKEGLDPRFIRKTGSPLKEVFLAHQKEIDSCDILAKLNLEKGKYLVISAHREENLDIDANLLQLISSLSKVVVDIGLPAIFSCHPRTRKKLAEKGIGLPPLLRLCEPFGYLEYIALQRGAYCVLSDSGSIAEECSILDFPAISIRTSTERQEAEIAGSIEHVGLGYEGIMKGIEKARITHPGHPNAPDYDIVGVAKMVADLIEANTALINREIWRK